MGRRNSFRATRGRALEFAEPLLVDFLALSFARPFAMAPEIS